MNLRLVSLFVLTGLLCFGAGAALEKHSTSAELESHIFRQRDARKSGADWGSIHVYTADTTRTVGTGSMLTAQLEFLPGKQLQPPHQHSQEEFQYIIEGTGTWFLNGIESPIEKGDLMYAKPGDIHGISNTGKTPLRFFVMKWSSKTATPPAHAAP